MFLILNQGREFV